MLVGIVWCLLLGFWWSLWCLLLGVGDVCWVRFLRGMWCLGWLFLGWCWVCVLVCWLLCCCGWSCVVFCWWLFVDRLRCFWWLFCGCWWRLLFRFFLGLVVCVFVMLLGWLLFVLGGLVSCVVWLIGFGVWLCVGVFVGLFCGRCCVIIVDL